MVVFALKEEMREVEAGHGSRVNLQVTGGDGMTR